MSCFLFQTFVFYVACSCVYDVASPPLAAIGENFRSGLASMQICACSWECFPLCLPTSSAGFWTAVRRLQGQHQHSYLSSGRTLGELPFKIQSPLAWLQQSDMSKISCHHHVSICIKTPGPYGGGLSDICGEHDPVWPYGGLTGTRNRTFFPPPAEKEGFFNHIEIAL